MATDDVHVADLLDTVHHEMDGMVRSHHVNLCGLPVIGEQLVLEKEPASQST